MKIYLLRHGSTALDVLKRSDGWLDLPLSDKGRMGLIPAQQYLKMEKLHAIHAADLRRTAETAHIVASGMVTEPNVVTHVRAKTWDLGVLNGMPKEVAHPKVKDLLQNPDTRAMGGETYNEFKKRFLPWFHRKVDAAKAKGKDLLIVCSGSNLRLLGQELFGNRQAFNMDEGGLVALYESRGVWHHQNIIGKDLGDLEVS